LENMNRDVIPYRMSLDVSVSPREKKLKTDSTNYELDCVGIS